MSASLNQTLLFDPSSPEVSLHALPEAPGIFALCPADPVAEPYLGKTPNLRRRLMRLLKRPAPGTSTQTRRLQLAHLVHRVEFSATGSDFESSLLLYEVSLRTFGERARKRLRLRPSAFLRLSVDNAYPRLYATTRISRAASRAVFGPFPSRAAAEHYAEELLNLFLLRRCFQELTPDPAFPGCVYSEMKMCLAPCFQGCSDARYREEAEAVFSFMSTRGESMRKQLEAERNAASEAMEFEQAAALHQRIQKSQMVAHLAGEAVRPLPQLSGIVVQPAAEPDQVALFALTRGVLSGPAPYSTFGMRLANERSGSSSLFAHPIALQPVPLGASPSFMPQDGLEGRLEDALTTLRQAGQPKASAQTLLDHVALFTQWFYRPATKLVGEMVFADDGGEVPRKPLLRAISRVAARRHSLLEENSPGAEAAPS